MTENQYYTPESDELHLGYEYEFLNGDKWESSEILPRDLYTETSGGEPCENWFEEIDKGLISIRTKYLSREDIEKEGWIFEAGIGNNIFRFSNKKLILVYNISDKELRILDQYDNIFKGNCNSINEFRKICRWLKIV